MILTKGPEMATSRRIPTVSRRLFLSAAALQIICGTAFLFDALGEWRIDRTHSAIELTVVVALWAGAGGTLWGLRRLLDRNAAVEEQLEVTTGAFHAMLQRRFDDWNLTPSERDVALLAVKGLSVAGIAELRATRESTIRAQQAAIYRKAGVTGRSDLLAHLIEEIATGLPSPAPKTDP